MDKNYQTMALEMESFIKESITLQNHYYIADDIRKKPCEIILEFLDDFSIYIKDTNQLRELDEFKGLCESLKELSIDEIEQIVGFDFHKQIVLKFKEICKSVKIR